MHHFCVGDKASVSGLLLLLSLMLFQTEWLLVQ
jgi:hypothetical protein